MDKVEIKTKVHFCDKGLKSNEEKNLLSCILHIVKVDGVNEIQKYV